jgi:hypothetical protein
MGAGRQRFELASLGDLMELLAEGWRIEHMHYADRSAGSGPPAAFFDLGRGAGEQRSVYVPDDGRAYSHRSLVLLFSESPHIWKHRTAGAIADVDAPESPLLEDWGVVAEPFPQALSFGPASLRGVVPVNQVQSIDGLDIALVALERHEGGARLRYMCHASGVQTRRDMRVLDVIAVDDGARRYRVAPIDSQSEGNRLEGAFALAPAIPLQARRLTVTIGTVREEGGQRERLSGPWVFPIPLAPKAP